MMTESPMSTRLVSSAYVMNQVWVSITPSSTIWVITIDTSCIATSIATPNTMNHEPIRILSTQRCYLITPHAHAVSQPVSALMLDLRHDALRRVREICHLRTD